LFGWIDKSEYIWRSWFFVWTKEDLKK